MAQNSGHQHTRRHTRREPVQRQGTQLQHDYHGIRVIYLATADVGQLADYNEASSHVAVPARPGIARSSLQEKALFLCNVITV